MVYLARLKGTLLVISLETKVQSKTNIKLNLSLYVTSIVLSGCLTSHTLEFWDKPQPADLMLFRSCCKTLQLWSSQANLQHQWAVLCLDSAITYYCFYFFPQASSIPLFLFLFFPTSPKSKYWWWALFYFHTGAYQLYSSLRCYNELLFSNFYFPPNLKDFSIRLYNFLITTIIWRLSE